MTLQLHDEGLAFNFRKAFRSAATIYNPYYRAAKFAYKRRPRFLRNEFMNDYAGAYEGILNEIEGTPTYYQFLNETGSTGLEDSGELAGRFGTWIKTKAVPGLKKAQSALSPIIGLLPGGGVVNAAFDIINRPKGGGGMAPEPQAVISPMAPQQFPQIAPMAPEPIAPNYAMAPAPAFFPQMAPPSGGINLPFGLTPLSLGAIAIGGILAYKLLKK